MLVSAVEENRTNGRRSTLNGVGGRWDNTQVPWSAEHTHPRVRASRTVLAADILNCSPKASPVNALPESVHE